MNKNYDNNKRCCDKLEIDCPTTCTECQVKRTVAKPFGCWRDCTVCSVIGNVCANPKPFNGKL